MTCAVHLENTGLSLVEQLKRLHAHLYARKENMAPSQERLSLLEACTYSCGAGRFGNISGQSSSANACPFACPIGRFGYLSGQQNESNACPNVWQNCLPGSEVSRNGTSTRTGNVILVRLENIHRTLML